MLPITHLWRPKGQGALLDLTRQVDLRAVLSKLIPTALFRPGFFLPDPPVFVVETLPLSETATVAIGKLGQKHGLIDIQLSPALALVKTVKMPKAAVAQAESAIRLQMRQSLPAQAAGLVWQMAQTGRSDQEAVFSVYVMKEKLLRQIAKAVRERGIEVRHFRFAGISGAPLLSMRADDGKAARRWAIATAALVGAVALWTVWQTEQALRAVEASNAALMAENGALEAELVALTTSAQDADGARQRLLSDLVVFDQQSVVLHYLSDLSRDLPDSVWISEMTINPQSMSISGFVEGEVANVLEIIQQQPWADVARLDGPVQFDTFTQQNRFIIGVTFQFSAGQAE